MKKIMLNTLVVVILLPIAVSAQTIAVTIVASQLTPQPGDTLSVSINVDMSEIDELLGNVQAEMTWSPDTVRYIEHLGATTQGFTSPIVNEQEVSEGRLQFINFNVDGADSLVNILNVRFLVVVPPDSTLGLTLEVIEMTAARTFVNLLPFIEIIVTDVEEPHIAGGIPEGYALQPNYPNPFNSGTSIGFALPEPNHVHLAIYNLLGQKLRTLLDAPRSPGRYTVNWDGTDERGKAVPSGIYLNRFQAGKFSQVRIMILVK